ncbi:MAG TPA: ABC transporter ATP-binding protein, partial [Cellvibrio sp.]|nr:ABC transporter ATP-binding protein [Cellvibrio sp.]
VMLDVNSLKRTYGDFVAVDGVTFSIGKGEIVGLLGHNGAGKTTIMKMLSGYLEPSGGQIKMDCVDLAQHLKKLQQKIGYLPESLPVYPEMTVADYLDYAASLKGLQGAQKQAEIKRVLHATAIGEKLLAPISTLSRGYKQRVGVAQAILGKPGLLILDEPTNGLDPTQTLQMRELIRDIAKEATVILSTHIMQEVDALCDRVLMVRGGRLVIDARLDSLRQSRYLQLATSPLNDDAISTLTHIPGIQVFEQQAGNNVKVIHRVTLSEDVDLDVVSAALAKAVIAAGADLYQLNAEVRDLESLFREVNQHTGAADKEDVRHAA